MYERSLKEVRDVSEEHYHILLECIPQSPEPALHFIYWYTEIFIRGQFSSADARIFLTRHKGFNLREEV